MNCKCKQKEPQVGDKVRMTVAQSSFFKVGDEGVLVGIPGACSEDYWVKFPQHGHRCCVGKNTPDHYNQFEVVTEASPQFTEMTLVEPPKPPVERKLRLKLEQYYGETTLVAVDEHGEPVESGNILRIRADGALYLCLGVSSELGLMLCDAGRIKLAS